MDKNTIMKMKQLFPECAWQGPVLSPTEFFQSGYGEYTAPHDHILV